MKFIVEVEVKYLESQYCRSNCFRCAFFNQKDICNTLSIKCEGGNVGYYTIDDDIVFPGKWRLIEEEK